MQILSNLENNEISPLNEKDLIYMGKQIRCLVEVYLNYVSISNTEDFTKLQVLSMISDALLKGNYQAIINDVSLIESDDANAESDDIEYKKDHYHFNNYPF